jgi:hypothetical protein
MLEESHLFALGRDDGFVTWLPVSWADLSVLVCKLEGLDESECLVNASSNSIVVYLNRSDLLLWINDEKASQSCSLHWIIFLGNQHSIISANVLADICKQWVAKLTKSSLVSWGLGPCQMSEVGVGWNSNNFSLDVLEILESVTEGDELGWAYVGEVKWVENHNQVLSFEVGQADLLEVSVDNGVDLREMRSHGSWHREGLGAVKLGKGEGGESSQNGCEFHIFVLSLNLWLKYYLILIIL